MDKQEGGGSADVDNFFFNNIFIKCLNVDKGRGGGGSDNVDKDFFCGLFKGSFGLFNAYFVLFGLFLPKTNFCKYL